MLLENLTVEVQIQLENGNLPAWLQKLNADGPDIELQTSIEGIAQPGFVSAGLILPTFEAEEVNHNTWRFPLWFEEAIHCCAISLQQVNSITRRLNNEVEMQRQDGELEAAIAASEWRYAY